MNTTISNIIEINSLLLLLFLLYKTIQNKLDFNSRRFILLLIPVLAFASYLFDKSSFNKANKSVYLVNLDFVEITNSTYNSSFLKMDMNEIYLIGVCLFLAFSIYKVIKILLFFRNSNYIKKSSYRLLITNKETSFSFFNFIHLSADLSENEKSIVLEHELIHCKKLHSLDLLIMEIYHAFFWYNPILFFLKKELNHVHEFQVDKLMFEKYNTSYIKHLLAYSLGVENTHFLLTSQFYNKLSLAKRTKIMKAPFKKSKGLLFTIPLLVIVFTLVSWTKSQNVLIHKTKVSLQEEEKIYNNVDQMPEFKGGLDAMFNFIAKNTKYPEISKANKEEGKVFVSFVVAKNGEITDVKIKRGSSKELNIEAVRVINSMPNWTPGKNKGELVNVEMIIPIFFKID